MNTDRYRIHPESEVRLRQHNPRDKSLFDGTKEEAGAVTAALNARLEELQELLWAEHRHKVLVVLQAMDAGGKDGTIRHVFDGTNPQGVKVAGFKVPTARERAHDYLWRVHKETPGSGEIVVFNRSHYEDVLVVRVEKLVPQAVWKRRFDHIKAFETLLVDEGTTILKFFLNISKAEQKERFQARLDEPHKNWKFSTGDLAVRTKWPSYMKAYQDALARTSTRKAPWYVIPADRKWYRNLVISKILVDTLEGLKMRYPEPEEGLDEIVIR